MTTSELQPDDWRRDVYQRHGTAGSRSRKGPTASERLAIVSRQGYVCLYCELPIGSKVHRSATRRHRAGMVILVANWDHFVPYSYLQSNPSANWVLACHVCNGIKSDAMYPSVDAAREAILPKRLAKGFGSPRKRHSARRGAGLIQAPPSEAQLNVLRLVAAGLAPKEAAAELGILPNSARKTLRAAQRRLGAQSTEEAIEVAIERGHFERPEVRLLRLDGPVAQTDDVNESRAIRCVHACLERLSISNATRSDDSADQFTLGVNWAIRAVREALNELP
ncbi:hypothetical protein ACFWRZ_07870 [Streptomyces rubiginosohelvolus]|uniref:hypothetical protein n=1 Tax=Streptomyces rubiginosohelvolus TaxID=67362 RepID=UPI003661CE36